MNLTEDEIKALLEAGGYELNVYKYMDSNIWGAIILWDKLPQTKIIRSPTRRVAVSVAYKHFIGETK